jgi:hypothetical protein
VRTVGQTALAGTTSILPTPHHLTGASEPAPHKEIVKEEKKEKREKTKVMKNKNVAKSEKI